MRVLTGDITRVLFFKAVDATDLKTPETGLSSFTVYRMRGTGAAAVMTTPTVTELDATNAPGIYKLLLDEDMVITAGKFEENMLFHITHASMAPVEREIELFRPPGFLRRMTAAAGSTGSVTLDGAGTTTEGAPGNFIEVVGGTGIGQSAIIATYTSGTKVATFVTNVGVALDATSIIDVYTSPPTIALTDVASDADMQTALTALANTPGLVWEEILASHLTSGSVGVNLFNLVTGMTALLNTNQVYQKNVAAPGFEFGMIDATTGLGATGKTVTVLVNKDSGAFGAPVGAVTEISNGMYKVSLSATEMNGDEIGFVANAAGCKTTLAKIKTQS